MHVRLLPIRVHSLNLVLIPLLSTGPVTPSLQCIGVTSPQSHSVFYWDRRRAIVGPFCVGDEIGDVKLLLK